MESSLSLLELKSLLECPRRFSLIREHGAFNAPSEESRMLHALKKSAKAWLNGDINKGTDLLVFYYGFWPEPAEATREENAAAKAGASMLKRWFRSHQLRGTVCGDGLLGVDETISVQYFGLRVVGAVDARWRKGDVEEYVLMFLKPPSHPETNLAIHHLWHHTMLNMKRANILVYNFTENCYTEVEAVSRDLYPDAIGAARGLLDRRASYPTLSGCSACRVSSRCVRP